MEIIHNHNTARKNAFTSVRGGKDSSGILRNDERDLLGQMSQALTVIYGGERRSRRGLSA